MRFNRPDLNFETEEKALDFARGGLGKTDLLICKVDGKKTLLTNTSLGLEDWVGGEIYDCLSSLYRNWFDEDIDESKDVWGFIKSVEDKIYSELREERGIKILNANNDF